MHRELEGGGEHDKGRVDTHAVDLADECDKLRNTVFNTSKEERL